MTESLSSLFRRNLNALKNELTAFSEEGNLWRVPKGVINSAGNLSLHLIGNLNHFIGSTLGKTNYIRKREAEFSERNIPLTSLLQQLDDTSEMITKVLSTLSAEDLKKTFPIKVFGEPMSTEYFLIHLLGHLEYHRGQVNYVRRILEGVKGS